MAPVAGTAMLETVMPKEAVNKLKPEFVAEFVSLLCHDECPESGSLFEVGGGHVSKLRFQRSQGVTLSPEELSVSNLLSNWGKISDFGEQTNPDRHP